MLSPNLHLALQDQKSAARVARVIVAGNSLYRAPADKDKENKEFKKVCLLRGCGPVDFMSVCAVARPVHCAAAEGARHPAHAARVVRACTLILAGPSSR